MTIISKLIESHYKPLILKEKHSVYQYQYFIDCFDLIYLLKGVKRVTEGTEPINKINNLSNLAYGLILDGWIDNIHLLPPHQNEFFDLMNLNFGIRNPHIKDEDIDWLISGYETDSQVEIKPSSNYKLFIENVVDKSLDRFNIFGLIRDNNWQKRLERLIGENVLFINEYSLKEIMPLINSDHFKRIKKATDVIRPKSSKDKSNFNDALALTYLLFLKRRKNEVIPILIDSTGFYSKIIKEARLTREFEYNLPLSDDKYSKKIRTSIVRDTAYFVLKSIFDCPPKKLKKIKIKFPEYFEILEKNSSTEIASIDTLLDLYHVKDNFFLEDQVLENLYVENKGEFKDYLENEFFNTVWLSSYANESFTDFIQNHYEYQKLDNLNHIKTIYEYKLSFMQTYNTVKKESEVFSVLTSIWTDISKTKPEKYLKNSTDNAFHALLQYGAFRFSLPYDNNYTLKEIEDRIAELLFENGLIGNEIERSHASNEIIKFLFEGIVNASLGGLSIAISILWSLGRYKSLNLLLSRYFDINEYPHFSFGVIHCASLLKESTDRFNKKKVERIVECIEGKIGKNNYFDYKYLIGKAYLYYLLWNSEFKLKNFSATLCSPVNESSFYGIALDSISKAAEFLGGKNFEQNPWQLMLYIYSLNLKIYMIIDGGDDAEVIALEKDVIMFLQCEESYSGFWQGRYDDTIARFNLRFALIQFSQGDQKAFDFYLRKAETRIKKAINNSFQDLIKKSNFDRRIFEIQTKYERGQLDDFLQQCKIEN